MKTNKETLMPRNTQRIRRLARRIGIEAKDKKPHLREIYDYADEIEELLDDVEQDLLEQDDGDDEEEDVIDDDVDDDDEEDDDEVVGDFEVENPDGIYEDVDPRITVRERLDYR